MAAFWSRKRVVVGSLLAFLVAGASAAVWFAPLWAAPRARTATDQSDFDRAEAIIDRTLAVSGWRDVEAVWMLRVMRGEVLLSRGDFAAATKALAFKLPAKYARSEVAVQQLLLTQKASDAVRALAIAQKHQPHLLGDVYRVLARLVGPRRENYALRAIAFARKDRRPATEAKAWTVLGHSYVSQSRYGEAADAFARARAIAETRGFAMTLQNAQGNLGWAYTELGDYDTAEELFVQAEETARRLGAKHERAPWLIQLGALSQVKRDYKAARQFTLDALQVHPRQAGLAYGNLANIAMELGQYAEARKRNAQALAAKQGTNDAEITPDDVLQSRILEARIAAVGDGDVKGAETMLLDVIAKAKKAPTRAEAQARLADVYARAHDVDKARHYYAAAFTSAREARKNISESQLRFAFFNLIEEMLDNYVDFLVANRRIDEALAVIEASRAESLKEDRPAPADFDPRTIAKEHDATILAYWLGRARSYLFVVRPNGVTLHDLRVTDIDVEKKVTAHRNAVLAASERVQQTGAELYAMLVAPAGITAGSRVLIAADGALHTLAFETLVPSPKRWWIEDVVVTHAGALQLLPRRVASKPAGEPSILLVGTNESPDPEFPDLPYAPGEMRDVARRFARRTVLEGAKATPAAYLASSPETYDYVHFVAHGVASRKAPLDSAIVLARDAATGSYKLLARDVITRPLNAKLVTISSCDSAGTRTYAGEGVVGLAWAFQKAGADQVIASLWKVNDAATSPLMAEMYRHIREGRDPADALREAKLAFVRSEGVTRHPKFWAPFVLYAGT